MTNRRDFLRMMVGGVAAGAAVRTWPFRVFSFPSQIVIREWVNISASYPDKSILLRGWYYKARDEEIGPLHFDRNNYLPTYDPGVFIRIHNPPIEKPLAYCYPATRYTRRDFPTNWIP